MTRWLLCPLAALLFTTLAPAQTTVRVRDAGGHVVVELFVAAPGSVEVIPGPNPQPNPQPNPGPNPQPPNPQPVPPQPPPAPPPNPLPNPAPIAGPVKHVVVISDAAANAMTPAQTAALRDPQVRTRVQAHGWAWHNFDLNSAEVQQKPPAGLNYVKWLNNPNFALAPNLQAPALLLLDAQGRPAKAIPLPADSATFIAAIGG